MSTTKLAFVGDIMCGDQFQHLGFGMASMLEKYGRQFLCDEILDVFSKHDIVVGNIEAVLSDIGRKDLSLRTLHMRGRPQTAELISKWGFTVAHVANNHILEHGVKAAIDTANRLEQAGVRVIGCGRNNKFSTGIKIVDMVLGETCFAFIGICFHPGKHAFSAGDLNDVIEVIRKEASQGKQVVLSVHWGDELIDRPNLWQRSAQKEFFDAGARMVIGHHAHVIQGVDSSNDGLVAYSLGNFIFDTSAKKTSWSMILSITIKDGRIADWEGIPVVIGKDFRPELAKGEKKVLLEKEISRRCDLVREAISDQAEYKKKYLEELTLLEKQDRRQLWKYIARNFIRLNPVYWPQIIMRPIQRRLGVW